MARRAYLIAGLLTLALFAGCRDELQGHLSEADANDMLDALYGAGVDARKASADGRNWTIEVESADLQRALRVTRDNGLPRQRFASTGELFKKEGLVSTPSEERVRYLFAVSQELSQTLSSIDGVINARVHPVIPQNDPLADKVRPSSASVFIKHRKGANLEAMAPAIKNLVMRSIEGLSYDNISLTFVTAEEPPRSAYAAAAPAAQPWWPMAVIVVLAVLLVAAVSGLLLTLDRLRPRWWPRRGAPRRPAAVPKPSSSNEPLFKAHG
jgi:type III secretion protein J